MHQSLSFFFPWHDRRFVFLCHYLSVSVYQLGSIRRTVHNYIPVVWCTSYCCVIHITAVWYTSNSCVMCELLVCDMPFTDMWYTFYCCVIHQLFMYDILVTGVSSQPVTVEWYFLPLTAVYSCLLYVMVIISPLTY